MENHVTQHKILHEDEWRRYLISGEYDKHNDEILTSEKRVPCVTHIRIRGQHM